jgi:hypothetical protein
MQDPNASMTAVVEFQIRAENTTMDEWLATWHARARDALEGEPETSAYEAAISDEDDSCVLVYERYARGNDSLKVHMERPAHAELTNAMGERNMTKRRVMGTRFNDVPDYGWWSRTDEPDVRSDAVVVLLGMRFRTDEDRDKFIELSGEHAAYCWDAEPDTLIYSGGIAAQDADRGPDIKAGDLIFVMVCTDAEAVDKHANDPNHIALGARFADAGVEVERTFMKTYRSTGQGYLSKPISAG